MSHPSLNAALKRLTQYRAYHADPLRVGNPYVGTSEFHDDIEWVTTALRLVDQHAVLTDAPGSQPTFAVRLPTVWREPNPGFLDSLNRCWWKTRPEDVG